MLGVLLHDDSVSAVWQLTAVESVRRDFPEPEFVVSDVTPEPYEI
jgi:hypothetical protein